MTEEAKKLVAALRNSYDYSERRDAEAADLIESLSAQLEQVTRERDAAVRCLKEELRNQSVISLCENCRYKPEGDYIPNDCMDCVNGCNWQWRGVEVDG